MRGAEGTPVGTQQDLERRRFTRVSGIASCSFALAGGGECIGAPIRDISLNGAYILAKVPPDSDASIRMDVLVQAPGRPPVIALDVRVVRREARGFAVVFDFQTDSNQQALRNAVFFHASAALPWDIP
ncbi:MAG: hypothetical protein GC168_09390 [Candidatus Hydrogenedens sp.]|nr:hypothetical protein [Candidatus Hydrogenedens sp.]